MIRLSPTAIVPDRIFTHPQHTIYDGRVLRYMIRRLCIMLESSDIPLLRSHAPLDIETSEADGRSHRLLIIRPDLLANFFPLCLVGFFGQRQVGTENQALQARDDLLVEVMDGQDGLISYTTLELTCGNFANCVLFDSREAKNAWGANPLHIKLARELSPQYYYSVRIYNGIVERGVMDPESLTLEAVKYFDYRQQTLWRAERKL